MRVLGAAVLTLAVVAGCASADTARTLEDWEAAMEAHGMAPVMVVDKGASFVGAERGRGYLLEDGVFIEVYEYATAESATAPTPLDAIAFNVHGDGLRLYLVEGDAMEAEALLAVWAGLRQ